MAFDPSTLETVHPLEHSATEPEPSTHPAKSFLHSVGLDVSDFPHIRFLIEVAEKSIRVGRCIIPLRLPDQPGYVYETVARIVRVLEVPATGGKGHRKFLEIEWIIADEPSIDEHNHPALSFLAAQVECASCREVFIPDPEVMSATSVRLACPNCLNYWSVSVAPSQIKTDTPELILDLFHKDQSKLRGLVTRWTDGPVASHDKVYYSFFPFHFENWNEGSSLEWLFDETRGWSALSNGQQSDFDNLIRGFLNLISLEHFKTTFSKSTSSQLDQTEIQRKTEIIRREETVRKAAQQVLQPLPDIERVPQIPKAEFAMADTQTEMTVTPIRGPQRAEARFSWTAPNTAVKSVPLEKTNSKKISSSSNGTYFAVGAAAIALIIVATVLIYHRATAPAQIQMSTASEVVVKSAPTEAPLVQVVAASPPPAQQAAPAPVKSIPDLPKIALPSKAVVQKAEKMAAVAQKKEEQEFKESAEQKRLREIAIDSSFRQGMLHLKLQQAKEAISEFKKVLSLDPKHAESFRGLGLAHVYEQDFEQAISSLTRYLALAGNSYDRSSVEELIATLRERTAKAD